MDVVEGADRMFCKVKKGGQLLYEKYRWKRLIMSADPITENK